MKNLIKRMLRSVIADNSLYLISGFCLLLGAQQIIGQSGAPTTDPWREVRLLAVLKVYEIMAVCCAGLVLRRFRVVNDGILLGCIALVLMVDPTFFNPRFYAVGRSWGLMVNGACLAVTAVGLLMLRSLARLPLSWRAVLGYLTSAAVIYLGASIMKADHSPANFDNPVSQDHLYYALCWGGVLMALAGRAWRETDVREGDGTAYAIYYRYLDTVLCYAPFLVFAGQLWYLQGIFLVSMSPAHVAPVVLGALVLWQRRRPGWFLDNPLPTMAFGAALVLISEATPAHVRFTLPHGFELSPLRVMLAVQAVLSVGFFIARENVAFWFHGTLCGALFAGAATLDLAAGNTVTLQAGPLAVITLSTLALALWTRWMAPVAMSGLGLIVVLMRASGMHGLPAAYVGFQLTAYWLVALGRVYPGSALGSRRVVILSVQTVVGAAAVHIGHGMPTWVAVHYATHLGACWIVGRLTQDRALERTSGGTVGAEVAVRSFGRLSVHDWSALVRSHGGVGLVLSAFVLLVVGVVISSKKSQMLAWLATDDEPESIQPLPRVRVSRV